MKRPLRFCLLTTFYPAVQLRRRRHRRPAAGARAHRAGPSRDGRPRRRRLSVAGQDHAGRLAAGRWHRGHRSSQPAGRGLAAADAADRAADRARPAAGQAVPRPAVRRRDVQQRLAGRRSGAALVRRRRGASVPRARALARVSDPRALAAQSRGLYGTAVHALRADYRRPPQLWRYTGYLDRQLRHVDVFIA